MLQVYGNIALLKYAYLGVFFYKTYHDKFNNFDQER